MSQLVENENISYSVVHRGAVLLESVPKVVALNFVSTLTRDVQEHTDIVPVTQDGLQVLLG